MPYIVQNILVVFTVVLYLVVAVVLIRAYRRTRNIGFVWLAVAVVVWPIISGLSTIGVNSFVDHANQHRAGLGFPFTLVERGLMTMDELASLIGLIVRVEGLIGVGVLLVAVLYLCKAKDATTTKTA